LPMTDQTVDGVEMRTFGEERVGGSLRERDLQCP
jgi:hypothetical protein